jgi:NADH-quinone oxidoreductase subunit J
MMFTIEQVVFLLTAALILVAAVQVVTAKNLVHAALWLIVTLFGMAIIFVLLAAGFLAVVQVVVYIGAISILIIFAIMLTRRVMQDTGPQTNAQWWVAALIALASFGVIWNILRQVPGMDADTPRAPITDQSLRLLGERLSSPDYYMLPLVVVGVLLAAGMIGSIAVARDKE